MTSTTIDTRMPTQRLLSGLYVPADLGDTTAPLDVIDRPQSTPEPSPTKPAPAAEKAPQEPPAPAPPEVFRPASPVPAPPAVPPPVVRPDPPKPPDKPGAEHFRMERALNIGYWMSVAVGAIGQIVSFGGMIAPNMPADMAWTAYLAAAMLAAFAEITMVGCGTAALKRRFNEGAWKALASIACLVCLYATALNAIHWYPVDPGMAIMFAGGSFLGFTAHFIAEHTAASDYEKALARYREATKIRQPGNEKHVETRPARKRSSAPKPATTKPAAGKAATKPKRTPRKPELARDEAVRWAQDNGRPGPSAVIRHFAEQGYATPALATMRRWLNTPQG